MKNHFRSSLKQKLSKSDSHNLAESSSTPVTIPAYSETFAKIYVHFFIDDLTFHAFYLLFRIISYINFFLFLRLLLKLSTFVFLTFLILFGRVGYRVIADLFLNFCFRRKVSLYSACRNACQFYIRKSPKNQFLLINFSKFNRSTWSDLKKIVTCRKFYWESNLT